MLATSQVPLKLPHEHLLRLDALALPAARVSVADPRFELNDANLPGVVEICRRLDGIPLALELAAARVPLLGVEGLRMRLSERFRLLTRGAASAQPHHQTLAAALDWSHGLLRAPERAVLRRLSVFAGGFSAAAAQQLVSDAGLDEWAVLDSLSALIEKSLVTPQAAGAAPFEEPRFTMLETVRDYARAQLQASDEAPRLARRHAEQFTALAEAHAGPVGGEQAGARRTRLAREHDNLRAALTWAVAHDALLGLRLAAALMPFWRERGHHAEAALHGSALLAGTDVAADVAARLPLVIGLAAMAIEQGNTARVQALGKEALQASRACGLRRREADVQSLLAHAAMMRNDLPGARACFEAGLLIHRDHGEPRVVAESLNNIASCWNADGQPGLAQPLLAEAPTLARARSLLGEAVWQQAWQAGHALARDDARALALAVLDA